MRVLDNRLLPVGTAGIDVPAGTTSVTVYELDDLTAGTHTWAVSMDDGDTWTTIPQDDLTGENLAAGETNTTATIRRFLLPAPVGEVHKAKIRCTSTGDQSGVRLLAVFVA